jgi:hypothetical protein
MNPSSTALSTTVLVFHVAIAQLALNQFPPLSRPRYSDVLRLCVLILLTLRLILTYTFVTVVHQYSVTMFVIELIVAFGFAAQLRLLDKAQGQEMTRNNMRFFYALHLAFLVTAILWSLVGSAQISALGKPTRYFGVRLLFVLIGISGIITESIKFSPVWLRRIRWIISSLLLLTIVYYSSTRPWEVIH